MKNSALKKSSFTLPREEVSRVKQLRKKLKLKSNTAVVRVALNELESKLDRENLRRQFREASHIVKKVNKKEMEEFDLRSRNFTQ